MGTDNLFQKRKAKLKFERKRASKYGIERILIVCEGEKTEPYYLTELYQSLGLTNTDVPVFGSEYGSDPGSILDYALERYQRDQGIDWVYCVFDKDSHTTYDETIGRAKNAKLAAGTNLVLIKSVPCFEYWVLLHFRETTKPYGKEKRSPCENLINDLKIVFPDYSKGMRNLHASIGEKTDFAISNAKKTMKEATKSDTDNPTTEMHLLVEHLRKLAKD